MISAVTGDVASLVIISTMVLFSVLLDSVQEYRAEQAAERLKISVALKEQVLRDGQEITVRADELVPGELSCSPPAIWCRPTAGSSRPGIFSSTRGC